MLPLSSDLLIFMIQIIVIILEIFNLFFFDQLLSATGPYQNFRVNAWKGKITLVNVSAADGAAPLPWSVILNRSN